MLGLMQDWPLTIDKIMDHARDNFPRREVVTRSIEGPITRSSYGAIHARAKQVTNALRASGVTLGDRVATLAWNSDRHMEIWYGAMNMGAVLHTVNPRLFPEQIAWIINHAEDKLLFLDLTFVPLVEKVAPLLKSVTTYVILTDRDHMPSTQLRGAIAYEDFIAFQAQEAKWGGFDEHTACGLCYTSGTTGDPKGVLYSHRSNLLHALAANQTDCFGAGANDVVLPVVPMFHANAWSLAFSCPMAGANAVMPGAKLDGASVYELLDTERVSMTAAVPTIWLMLLQYLEQNPALKLPYLERVLIGGASCPEPMMRAFVETYGVDVIHAWGMTEMSPMGTLSRLKGSMLNLPPAEKWKEKLKQGRPGFGIDMKITDDRNEELAHDGKVFGRLKVRGPAISSAYFKGEGSSAFDADGWFDTGDVSTIDEWGFMQITDRSKDVIKSGGEWISSIDLENAAMGCAGVAEAAAIGLPHPKWDERPLLVVVRKAGAEVTKDEVIAHMNGKVAKWWMPDDVAFVDDIPHTATGKISKLQLRERFKDYRLPTA